MLKIENEIPLLIVISTGKYLLLLFLKKVNWLYNADNRNIGFSQEFPVPSRRNGRTYRNALFPKEVEGRDLTESR